MDLTAPYLTELGAIHLLNGSADAVLSITDHLLKALADPVKAQVAQGPSQGEEAGEREAALWLMRSVERRETAHG